MAGKDILSPSDTRFTKYRKQWDENPRLLTPGWFPLHIDIESTSVCNLKCTFCKTIVSRKKTENGFMSWETLTKILDESGENGLYACKFNFRGEPLLHKDIGKFIEYAKFKGVVDVFFNTNATLLTEDKSRMLITSGLDRLTISFEGYEKDMYEKSRIGAIYEDVVANVERLRNIREQSNSPTPKIRLQAVLIPQLKDYMSEFVDFWKDKVDQVSYNDMFEDVAEQHQSLQSTWICPFPYQRMTILWDGTMVPCPQDYYGEVNLGNIHTTTIQQTWTVSLGTLRKKHVAGYSHDINICAKCPIRALSFKQSGNL
ncbi:MAG: radical SAM protein [Nitrospirae bacterium]|nr:radical SAM protein [Nitrospirota bacterium]